VHDVGKVGIPDAILNKPGPLNADEWDLIRQHTILGERILSAAPAMRPVARIVRATHERWDGGGYPDGLRGEQIPIAARIVAVCDAYQAMTADRAYRATLGHRLAFRELRSGAGTQFDPAVVDAFLAEVGSDVRDDEMPAPTASSEIATHVRELLTHSPA
jgi:HD-GYP domain-containing protein (c-di-GMP phosphodiesterase class II)